MILFHVAPAGNECMAHIASLFAEGCATEGVEASVVVGGYPLEADFAETLSVVVAPHEYFPLHFLRSRPTIELPPTLDRVAVLNVEQPGSEWFEKAWEFARRSRIVFDISLAGVDEFRRRGVTAHHVPLGYTPSLEAVHRKRVGERAVDVLFFGHASARRNAFFARHAGVFSGLNCRIVLSDVTRPRTRESAGYRHGDARLRMMAESRIVLAVHSTERAYFEQHRAMLALANGCLLVTETSRHLAPLEAGLHVVAGELDALPALCRRYLDDPAQLEQVAAAGHQFVKSDLPIRRSCAVLLDVLGRPADLNGGDRHARSDVRRRLADSLALAASGHEAWMTVANAAYDSSPPPAVSVLVTLFNYRHYVERCLQSVLTAGSFAGGLEIVVVDDASSDAGAEAVAAIARDAAVPLLLVQKQLNTGLADARNVGLGLARGRHVFVLDADNWIYPKCLDLLHAALDGGDFAAAYGMIARVEDGTDYGVDLMSLDWDPRRLIEGPYIDAMAMVDREAVLSVGGYSTELVDYGWFGWEDYDLWLKLAQAGKSCRLVPSIVAGYRDHRAAMLGRTNRDTERLATYFRTKFADLLARHPGLDTYFSFPATTERLSPEEAEIARLRSHTTALEQQLSDMYASRSWKVTAPLRVIGEWIGSWGQT